MAETKKKKRLLPHYGHAGYSGAVFAPLYGPWAAFSTGGAREAGDDEDADDEAGEASPSSAGGAGAAVGFGAGNAGAGGGNAGSVGESGEKIGHKKRNEGMARKSGLARLNEDLDYLSQVLGGMNAADLPDMFFNAPLVADPSDQTNLPVDAMLASLVDDEDEDGDEDEDDGIIDIDMPSPLLPDALTAIMHKTFTGIADDLLMLGNIDQPQRIGLSKCIGVALAAFMGELSASCPWAEDMEMDAGMVARFLESKRQPKKRSLTEEESWKDKKVKNPKTGNMVKVGSLPPEEQARYKPKAKQVDVVADRKKARTKSLRAMSDLKRKAAASPVIGKTQSGKKIYADHRHPAHREFTMQDHYDASDLHKDLHDKHGSEHGDHEFHSMMHDEAGEGVRQGSK